MKRKISFEEGEINVIINVLIAFRSQLIAEGKYSDVVDDIIIKLYK